MTEVGQRCQSCANAGGVPRRGSDVGTSPLLGFSGSETTPDNPAER